MWRRLSVNILNGAVSLGVFAFSPLAAFAFLAFGAGFAWGLSCLRGGLAVAFDRALRDDRVV